MELKARILTPEGEIIKALMKGPYNTIQILNKVSLGKSTVYNNLKDLLLAGWVVRDGDSYRVTGAGVRAYVSEVLPGADVDALLGYSRLLGVSVLELVELGARVVMAVVEAAYVPADLARLLSTYDPSALERLEGLFGRRDDEGRQAQAAEVVA